MFINYNKTLSLTLTLCLPFPWSLSLCSSLQYGCAVLCCTCIDIIGGEKPKLNVPDCLSCLQQQEIYRLYTVELMVIFLLLLLLYVSYKSQPKFYNSNANPLCVRMCVSVCMCVGIMYFVCLRKCVNNVNKILF